MKAEAEERLLVEGRNPKAERESSKRRQNAQAGMQKENAKGEKDPAQPLLTSFFACWSLCLAV